MARNSQIETLKWRPDTTEIFRIHHTITLQKWASDMRDPERIHTLLEQLELAWLKQPDYRLDQLIFCAVAPKVPCPEISGIEDDVLLNKVVKFMDQLDSSRVD